MTSSIKVLDAIEVTYSDGKKVRGIVTSVIGAQSLKMVAFVPAGCKDDVKHMIAGDEQCRVIPDNELFILPLGTVVELFGARYRVIHFDTMRNYTLEPTGRYEPFNRVYVTEEEMLSGIGFEILSRPT